MSGTTAPPRFGEDLTEDRFLSGRLVVRQPAAGYRAAIDPVILAAALPVRAGDSVVDLGTGVGTAALCLLERQPRLAVAALELHPGLAALARENACLNGFADRLTVIEGDVRTIPEAVVPGTFDHACCNPPYLARDQGRGSPSELRRLATQEGEAELEDWIAAGLRLLRAKGSLTVVHRADALPRLLAALEGRAGGIVIAPLWPRAGQPASRVVVRVRKDSRAPARLAPGLVLHEDDGRYTAAAESVLRHGQPFDL